MQDIGFEKWSVAPEMENEAVGIWLSLTKTEGACIYPIKSQSPARAYIR
jgi:hypothetical protein